MGEVVLGEMATIVETDGSGAEEGPGGVPLSLQWRTRSDLLFFSGPSPTAMDLSKYL
jgi:hypothetical protein